MLYSIHTTQKHRFAAILHAHVEPSSTKHHAPERPTLYTFLAPAYPTPPHSAYPIHALKENRPNPPTALPYTYPNPPKNPSSGSSPQPAYTIHPKKKLEKNKKKTKSPDRLTLYMQNPKF